MKKWRRLLFPTVHKQQIDNYQMSGEKLKKHVQMLCMRNLKSDRVKCCATCPFETIILRKYPHLKKLFIEKKRKVEKNG